MVKWAFVGILASLWVMRFVSEEFLLSILPKEVWWWIGILGLIYFGHRLGKKNWNLKGLLK